MNIQDKICGFTVVREKSVPDVSATLYELEHDKTGAKLCYLDRKDDNMSFAISFATPPEDDTGVFHIIEHSVLCGSEKYPLRDPFAELLKGSLNTFLNAMTYEDRTVYPVSSRCERDFLNLVDVYLDATMHPNVKTNPNIFRQEGWHYEYDGERLTRSGVVYNEMKGAYSSPDDLGLAELNRALFEGGTYSKDSGGDPNAIPTLTHRELVRLHDKYYHPSGAQIFLDGTMNVEAVLSLIDSHLSVFDKKEIHADCIPAPARIARRTVSYEVSEDGETDKARVLMGYVFSDQSKNDELMATAILCDYLCGSNASPLKRTLLESGLCKDLNMYTNRSEVQTLVIEARDAKAEDLPKIEKMIESRIKEIAEGGLDKDNLAAALDIIEFKLRERDFGSFPTGIAFALSVFGAWRFGSAPESALVFEDTVAALRERIKTDYFEQLLIKMTLENPHRAVLNMIPDGTLAERRAAEEEKELARILKGMTAEELEQVKAAAEELRAWQQTEESDEARATLPTLSISDIPKKTKYPTVTELDAQDCRALHITADTNGISYLHLLFDVSDIAAEDLWKLSLASNLLLNLDTAEGDALSLQNRIKASLGKLSISTVVTDRDGVAVPYLHVSASVLDSKKEKLIAILKEALLTSDFNNVREIENTVAQSKSYYEDSALSSGHAIAIGRVEAYSTSRGAINEYMSGYEAYIKLKALDTGVESLAALGKELGELTKNIMTASRLTVALSGAVDNEFISSVAGIFPQGSTPERVEIAPLGRGREFILTPSKVAYAIAGASLAEADKMSGALRTVRSILSYEYLWTTVRMEGGAYGAGFVSRRGGLVAFYSYRDPSPARTLGCFKSSADYLRTVAKSGTDLTKFIIGAFGEYDVLTTPQSAAAIALVKHLNGVTAEDENNIRRGLLETSLDDLVRAAELIDRAISEGSICIVGGKEHLDTCRENVENILKL